MFIETPKYYINIILFRAKINMSRTGDLSPKELENIKSFRYKTCGLTPLETYIYDPFWTFLANPGASWNILRFLELPGTFWSFLDLPQGWWPCRAKN